MPGGRLSSQDRRVIADGLGSGLPYSELARRLGRPTSTVSREVLRNGGRDAYRPDLAQRETRLRARRRKSTTTGSVASGDVARGGAPRSVREFEERFTAFMISTGAPRMMARVLTCLYTTDSGSLTAAELVQKLKVSPASISTAIGFLESQQLVRRERDPRGRRERYIIDDDAWCQAMLNSGRNNLAMAEVARGGAELFGLSTPTGDRFRLASQFLERFGHSLIRESENWRAAFAARRPVSADGS